MILEHESFEMMTPLLLVVRRLCLNRKLIFGIIVVKNMKAKRFFGNALDDHEIGAGDDGFDLVSSVLAFAEEKSLLEKEQTSRGFGAVNSEAAIQDEGSAGGEVSSRPTGNQVVFNLLESVV